MKNKNETVELLEKLVESGDSNILQLTFEKRIALALKGIYCCNTLWET